MIGLFIPPYMLTLGLCPADTMALAEIHHLSARLGFCFAAKRHFTARFGWSSRTVYMVLSRLESEGLIRREGGNIYLTDLCAECAKVAPNSAKVAYDEGVQELQSTVQELHTSMQELHSHLNREVNKESNKKEPYSPLRPDEEPEVDLLGLPVPKKTVRKSKKTPDQEWVGSNYGFDGFWLAYPKHEAKAVALRSWLKIQPSQELAAEIIAHVAKRKTDDEQWAKDGGKFVPMPATFLNQQRWTDEYEGKQSAFDGDGATATEPIWPGTPQDRLNPEFNPGAGWRQEWGVRVEPKTNREVRSFCGWVLA